MPYLKISPIALSCSALLLAAVLPANANPTTKPANAAQPATSNPDTAATTTAASAAQTVPADTSASAFSLDGVVVTASKNAQKQSEADTTTNVVNDKQIQRKQMQSIDNLFDYTPSVSVAGALARGDAPINIRGITDNRVQISVDGVRQPKNISSGNLNTSRHFVDVNTLKRVEVIPGPASSLHGSDALGGVVTYITKEPEDLLRDEDRHWGGTLSSSYDSSNQGVSNTIGMAGRVDGREGMVLYTHRKREETKNKGELGGIGANREQPDPVEGDDTSLLAKAKFSVGEGQTLKITQEHVKSRDDVQNYSGSTAATAVGSYNDKKYRDRTSLEYRMERPTRAFDSMTLGVDVQDSESKQFWNRVTASTDQKYLEKTQAINATFRKEVALGNTKHQLTYGVAADQTEMEQWRLSSGALGEGRTVPKAKVNTTGIYLQDQIQVNDKLRLTPGVRHDSYKTKPESDPLYLKTNPAGNALPTNDRSKTAYKLGMTYNLTQRHQAFGQYAQGFKTPDLDQLYKVFEQPTYKGLANPNLRPESSDSLEAGYRFKGARGDLEVAVFHNKYKDFITDVTLSTAPPYTLGIVQPQNLQDVTINGAEIKGSVDVTDHIQLRTAVAYAKGTNKEKGVNKPLDTIAPLHGVVGVAYDAPSGNWGTELTVRAAKGKEAKDVAKATPFLPSGYGVADLTAYRQLGKDVRLDAGIYNIADKKYWEWETARRQVSSGGGQARLTEPERHAKVGVTWDF